MKVKKYDYLSEDAKNIRASVFIQEQGFEREFDAVDDVACQIVMYEDDNQPIATCRVFEDSQQNQFVLGRLAVMKDYRGKNIGSKMLQEAENIVLKEGGTSIILHAQCRVKEFYERMGYVAFGKIEEDEGCPHIWMKKELNSVER